MKKVVAVLAIAVMSIGLYSCEQETSVEDTQALYETNDFASDDVDVPGDDRQE